MVHRSMESNMFVSVCTHRREVGVSVSSAMCFRKENHLVPKIQLGSEFSSTWVLLW